jgi:hypothetical protein
MLGPNVDQKTNSSNPTISGLALIYQGVVETVFSQSLAPIAKFNNVFSEHSMNNVDVDMEFFVYPASVWINAQKRDQIPASPRSGS